MRKHRFYWPNNLTVNQDYILDEDLSHQIINVLRLQPHAQIYLFNNTGAEFTAIIQQIRHKTVTISIIAVSADNFESPLKINLGQVISKNEKMDLVIQKATELGVNSISPLYSEFSIMKHANDRINNKVAHWQKIANAACCQCWRNTIPNVNLPKTLTTWIHETTDQYKIILSPHDTNIKLHNVKLTTHATVSILIGPEGGFSEQELAYAIEHNFTAISLGPRILRTETASLAAIAILQSLYGDL